MHGAFVPKSRRLRFQLTLRVHDLNNVPLVSGSSYIKWHLPSSNSAEHRGRTDKRPIREHSVLYDYEKSVPVRLTVDKNNTLQDTFLLIEVVQEYASGSRGESIRLGNVRLNLAEYTENDGEGGHGGDGSAGSEGEEGHVEGVTRRYLMRDSKINSTLKVGIHMKLLEGDRNFVAPTLKTAPVFGGIAGIMAGEQGDSPDDVGNMPSLTTKSREAGEAQDLYRSNLAAHFSSQPGQLRADEVIEDIFAGGDGWGPNGREKERDTDHLNPASAAKKRDWSRAGSAGRVKFGDRKESAGSLRPGMGSARPSSAGKDGRGNMSGTGQEGAVGDGPGHKPTSEVDEFEVREHLRSWVLPSEKVT